MRFKFSNKAKACAGSGTECSIRILILSAGVNQIAFSRSNSAQVTCP